MHTIRVEGVPPWVDVRRLLGEALPWRVVESAHVAEGPREEVARIDARLRGVGLGGHALVVHVAPPVGRPATRKARLEDARLRRETTPGFLRKGTRTDDEGRLSLTPESLALAIAESLRVRSVVDACCGVGGNAIAFARGGALVDAIELDPSRLALARDNARLYGVQDRIRFHAGDARRLLPTLSAEAVFVDPPWGGAGWNRICTDLASLPLLADLLPAIARFPVTVLKVPPSFIPLVGFTPRAVFGDAPGDHHRIKFLLLERKSP